MDPRRKKAVVFAAVPACMSGSMTPLITHFHHSRYLPFFVCGMVLLLTIPLALAVRELHSLKKDGNPY